MSLFDDVYGLSYENAEHKTEILNTELTLGMGRGFATQEELEKWAHDHLLDKVVYMNMSHKFFFVSHKGELLASKDYLDYYRAVLFTEERHGAKISHIAWQPSGYKYFDKAYIAAEQTDGIHRPLYYRDYTVPSGYYNEERDAFNVAKPFPVFAKETGRDTSHIYTYINHIAGECAPWLLAWLRAKLLYPTVKTQVVPIIVSRAQGSGKGQPLTSKVLTPAGFKALAELKDGDFVVSPVDGKAYPISIHNRGKRHVNKITMSNGAVTYCDDFHIWQARTVAEQSKHKNFHEMTIEDIKARPLKKYYAAKKGGYYSKQIFVQTTNPISGTKELHGAYAIGLFIGDGCYNNNSIYIDEHDVLARFKASLAELGYKLTSGRGGDPHLHTPVMDTASVKFPDFLASIGVKGRSYEKRLPEEFLQYSLESRQQLLEGLIDSDGYMSRSNNIDWTTTSENLYEDMYNLASSLGFVVRKGATKAAPKFQGGTGRTAYRLYMKFREGLHLSVNHMAKLKNVQHQAYMAFESIEGAGMRDCCCIYVESPDHLYITDDWIVTHNTTFAEVICKGMFGKENVIVSDQYDSQARFNADYADALIVCQEEKEELDKRNPAGAIKSRATATTVRKEQKGVDPIYQESYTDFIVTTNKDVPIKFDGREDQRRFMIMEADEHFTRKEFELADEVFSKLYGYDANNNRKGTPFVEDKELIAQFKHELFTREDIAKVPLKSFPKTAAYNKCFSIPRTSEQTEIESIMRALAPFIRASLESGKVVEMTEDAKLSDIIQFPGAMQFMPEYKEYKKFVALCRPLVFYDMATGRTYPHATTERGIYDCAPWLLKDFGIAINPNMEPLPGGFANIAGRYKMAPTARFCLAQDAAQYTDVVSFSEPALSTKNIPERIGKRLMVNDRFRPDENGCFETVNEMKPGTADLTNKSQNVQYMDTFLLESDDTSHLNVQLEKQRAEEWKDVYGESKPIEADMLYRERLASSLKESERLFNEGIACRLVYSGAKSYHLLVRVKEAPQTLEEYSWLHAYLATSVSDKLVFDESTSDPARLTRSPLELSRYSVAYGVPVTGTQKEVLCDWSHIYNIKWRDLYDLWKNRPLSKLEQVHGKRLRPTRKEYKEAAEAILDTTFWTDTKWDGERQRCFFPAYRLLRLAGYTHQQLWNEGILTKGVEKYKHSNEIGYWKTRYKSSIVREIDQQIDEYEEQQNGTE